MTRPPDDDDPLRDVLDQVSDALDQLNLTDPKTQQAVEDGIRKAFRALGLDGPGWVPGVGDPLDDEDDGPLDEEGDDEDGPHLRVVRTDEIPRYFDPATSEVRVRVLNPGGGHPFAPGRPLKREGQVRLEPGIEAPWQTVYRGVSPRCYRLACTTGQLDVALDGELLEQVSPGQTLDVEATLIRVRRGSEILATGTYARV